MNKTKAWIKAFRLRTLPLSFSSIITGSSVAMLNNSFRPLVFILALITTLFLQILSNLANDYGDFLKGTDNENRVGPDRTLQSGLLTIKEMKTAIQFFVLLSLISGISLIYFGTQGLHFEYALLFFGAGLLAIAAAIFYTVGKKAYGYSGMGDLFVFLFFGIVGVVGVCFLHQHTLDITILIPASVIGLLSTAVLNMNNMRDHVNDKLSSKNTIVVKLGFEKARYYHFTLLFLAFAGIFGWLQQNFKSPVDLIQILPVILLLIHLFKVQNTNEPSALDPELKKIALSTFLYSLLLMLSAAN